MKSTDILVTLQEYRHKHPAKSISFEMEGELVAEVERLREGEDRRLQLLDDVGGLENERDGQQKRADSFALAYREQQGENDTLRAAHTSLSKERDLYREAWAKAQARLDCGSDAADALAGERAAVVAWLSAEANEPHPIEAGERALSPSGRGLLLRAADAIERGEHRREEDK